LGIKRILAWLLVVAAILYLVIRFLIGGLGFNAREFDGTWKEEQGGFSTVLPVLETTVFCLCPAYACEIGFEAVLLHSLPFGGGGVFSISLFPKHLAHRHHTNYSKVVRTRFVSKPGLRFV
jgi:hypothetical protein